MTMMRVSTFLQWGWRGLQQQRNREKSWCISRSQISPRLSDLYAGAYTAPGLLSTRSYLSSLLLIKERRKKTRLNLCFWPPLSGLGARGGGEWSQQLARDSIPILLSGVRAAGASAIMAHRSADVPQGLSALHVVILQLKGRSSRMESHKPGHPPPHPHEHVNKQGVWL